MENSKTHIYFIPGLAANSNIFDYIQLPKDSFELHFLEWLMPLHKKESISNYSKRMADLVTEQNAVLVGVSFGGIIVQEMSKHINVQKIFIISSIKSSNEYPKFLKIIRYTKIYKLVTPWLIHCVETFYKLFFGSHYKKRIDFYKTYLSVRDKGYLQWALHTVLHWKQKETMSNVVHIQGTKDEIFPAKCIQNCIKIENGTHVMILFKAKKISEILLNDLTIC